MVHEWGGGERTIFILLRSPLTNERKRNEEKERGGNEIGRRCSPTSLQRKLFLTSFPINFETRICSKSSRLLSSFEALSPTKENETRREKEKYRQTMLTDIAAKLFLTSIPINFETIRTTCVHRARRSRNLRGEERGKKDRSIEIRWNVANFQRSFFPCFPF